MCTASGHIDVETYVALHTKIDYDGLLDLLEMHRAEQSWTAAAIKNAREEPEHV